jgi:elongation factor G
MRKIWEWTFQEIPVPAELVAEVAEWRGKLLEAVAEYNDT